jgi:hypothetical protein
MIVFIILWLILVVFAIVGTRKEAYYANWDFMDLANSCGGRKRKPSEDDFVPRFGGIPNQGEVWGIGNEGGCGCSKVFH